MPGGFWRGCADHVVRSACSTGLSSGSWIGCSDLLWYHQHEEAHGRPRLLRLEEQLAVEENDDLPATHGAVLRGELGERYSTSSTTQTG